MNTLKSIGGAFLLATVLALGTVCWSGPSETETAQRVADDVAMLSGEVK